MRHYIKKAVTTIALLIIITWIFKSFLFSIYKIPSFSMYPTLLPDDYILVSKFKYNLRTPEFYPLSKIPFPFYTKKGFFKVKRDDLVILNSPISSHSLHPNRRTIYAKRLVGIPEDTLLITTDGFHLKKLTDIDSDKQLISTMIIPGKGDLLNLVDSTKKSWVSIIKRDGNEISYDEFGNILVNGTIRNKYKVQQNYYFLMGDNMRMSDDSRNWGLVPERDLIGKIELIL